MANNGNNSGDGAQEAPTWFDEWSGRTPAITRYTLFSTLAPSIVCWVMGTAFAFANCPMLTLVGLQLWRLLTAPFVGMSVISIIISTFIFASMAPKRERALGSMGFLVLICTFAFGSQLLFSTIILILVFNPIYSTPMLAMSCSSGLSVVWLALMALDCAEEPEQERRVLFFPVQVKNKYYPFILVGIFSLLFGIQFDSLAALCAGYLYAWGYVDFVKPSPDKMRAWETGCLSFMSQWMGYIPVDQAGVTAPAPGGRDVEAGGASGDIFGRGRAAAAAAPATARATQQGSAFPGSGHSLGGAPGGGAGSGSSGGAGSSSKKMGGGSATKSGTSAPSSARMEMLAALERRLGSTAAASAPAPGTGMRLSSETPPAAAPTASAPASMELKLLQMQELGFDRAAALTALHQTNGDVDRAASLLS